MSRYVLGRNSRARLDTCHPAIVLLVERVFASGLLPMDIAVLCGHRGQVEQDAAFKARRSKLRWPKSKHNQIPSLAVDIVPWVGKGLSWEWPDYHLIAPVIKAEWARMEAEGLTDGRSLTWGGDWKGFPDGPHWELG